MYPVCYRGRMGSFFLISNKYVYSLKKLPHAKGHKANQRVQKENIKKLKKILIKKERTKEHRERFTRGESPSPRQVKKGATERSKQLIVEAFHVLKRLPISLPPNTPYYAQRN